MSTFKEKWVNNGLLEVETVSGQFVCEASFDNVVNYIVQMHNHYLDMAQKANVTIVVPLKLDLPDADKVEKMLNEEIPEWAK